MSNKSTKKFWFSLKMPINQCRTNLQRNFELFKFKCLFGSELFFISFFNLAIFKITAYKADDISANAYTCMPPRDQYTSHPPCVQAKYKS